MGNLESYIIGYDSDNNKYDFEIDEINEIESISNTNKVTNTTSLSVTGFSDIIRYDALKYFPKLSELKINDTKISKIPIEILKLTNLKSLSINSITYFEEDNTPNIDLSGISKLVNLENLTISTKTDTFPNEILQLKNLKTLWLQTFSKINVPIEICDLENLYELQINSSLTNRDNTKIIYKNKAIIASWYSYLQKMIFENNITELKILDCELDELTDLPDCIEILRLGKNVSKLSNLPVSLKKLYIWNNLPYFNVDDIKIPFGCELILID